MVREALSWPHPSEYDRDSRPESRLGMVKYLLQQGAARQIPASPFQLNINYLR